MSRLLKKLGMLAIGASLFVHLQGASAQSCCAPDPCCNPCMDMCGDWEVYAHALLFLPTTCEFDFATLDQNLTGTPYQWASAKCDLDWGVRVGGRYVEQCWFAGLSYQWYESTSASSIVGDAATNNVFLDGFLALPTARTTARLKLRYQNVDFRMGKFLHHGQKCNFYLFGNARWVDLEYRRNIRGVQGAGGVIDYNEKAQLQGGALGVGTGGEFDLWCDVGIFGELNLLGVIADRQTKNNEIDILGNLFAHTYRSDVCVTPELVARIGLNYEYSCGCGTIVGELGYELDYFWDPVNFSSVSTLLTTPAFKTRMCENVGFSGLFFGARYLF